MTRHKKTNKQATLAHKTSFRNEWVQKMMKIWDKNNTDECLRCRKRETTANIMACKDKAEEQNLCNWWKNYTSGL